MNGVIADYRNREFCNCIPLCLISYGKCNNTIHRSHLSFFFNLYYYIFLTFLVTLQFTQ